MKVIIEYGEPINITNDTITIDSTFYENLVMYGIVSSKEDVTRETIAPGVAGTLKESLSMFEIRNKKIYMKILTDYDLKGRKVIYKEVPKIDGVYNIVLPIGCNCPGAVDDPFNTEFKDYNYKQLYRLPPMEGIKFIEAKYSHYRYFGGSGVIDFLFGSIKNVAIINGTVEVPIPEVIEIAEEAGNIDDVIEFFLF